MLGKENVGKTTLVTRINSGSRGKTQPLERADGKGSDSPLFLPPPSLPSQTPIFVLFVFPSPFPFFFPLIFRIAGYVSTEGIELSLWDPNVDKSSTSPSLPPPPSSSSSSSTSPSLSAPSLTNEDEESLPMFQFWDFGGQVLKRNFQLGFFPLIFSPLHTIHSPFLSLSLSHSLTPSLSLSLSLSDHSFLYTTRRCSIRHISFS